MGLSTKEHIVVHGFITEEDGNQTWAEISEATGYCVYRRGVTSEDGEFDLHDEKDFETLEAAEVYAKELSTRHGDLEIYLDY